MTHLGARRVNADQAVEIRLGRAELERERKALHDLARVRSDKVQTEHAVRRRARAHELGEARGLGEQLVIVGGGFGGELEVALVHAAREL